MNNNENKKKSEIVYKTVEETIVVTEEDVDVKWIQAVNDSMREDANYARKKDITVTGSISPMIRTNGLPHMSMIPSITCAEKHLKRSLTVFTTPSLS